jgi:transglutaminase-like putative cysteine protease
MAGAGPGPRCYDPGMHFQVRHETLYRYSVPVQLATHRLRLNPRVDSVSIASQSLQVHPHPVARIDHIDPFGNRITELGFQGTTDALRIESRFELETRLPAAIDAAPRLPWPVYVDDGLSLYRVDPTIDASVAAFAAGLASQVGHEPLPFLDQLTHALSARTDKQLRLAGAAQLAAVTLASAQGSCRDLTVLFIAACRSMGIASRFTSGYLAPKDNLDLPRELHAWAEVFLPGAGWRGFDPSLGLRVFDAHVPLCAAPVQEATMPVEGGYFFQGASVTTTLDFDLRIRVR